MPDITMCLSEVCLKATTCYRHEASGKKPSEYRQSWFLGSEFWTRSSCSYYSPIKEKEET